MPLNIFSPWSYLVLQVTQPLFPDFSETEWNRFLPRWPTWIYLNYLARSSMSSVPAVFSPTNKMYFICSKQMLSLVQFRFYVPIWEEATIFQWCSCRCPSSCWCWSRWPGSSSTMSSGSGSSGTRWHHLQVQIINSAPDTPSMAQVWDRGYRFGSGWFHMTFFDMDPERTMDQNPDPGSDLFFEN